jgi:hypothetical protein
MEYGSKPKNKKGETNGDINTSLRKQRKGLEDVWWRV